MVRQEEEKIERFRQMGPEADFSLVSEVFNILAKREFVTCNEHYAVKE